MVKSSWVVFARVRSCSSLVKEFSLIYTLNWQATICIQKLKNEVIALTLVWEQEWRLNQTSHPKPVRPTQTQASHTLPFFSISWPANHPIIPSSIPLTFSSYHPLIRSLTLLILSSFHPFLTLLINNPIICSLTLISHNPIVCSYPSHPIIPSSIPLHYPSIIQSSVPLPSSSIILPSVILPISSYHPLICLPKGYGEMMDENIHHLPIPLSYLHAPTYPI